MDARSTDGECVKVIFVELFGNGECNYALKAEISLSFFGCRWIVMVERVVATNTAVLIAAVSPVV
jgi:hypothetical protein